MLEASKKITADHLKRSAYLYIRQSTLKQVMEHTESTERQYALRDKAIALGWPIDRITVIDNDLGRSGAQAADREGFQKMVAEVGLGNAGIVMGLEVSRLARNSTDWHRLLEICALSNTLILDEDGIYDPTHYNDRLLLGLKGTMSEAELHILHARLRGARLNKAKKGELRVPLPIGFIYDLEGRTILHPDKQIQETLYLIFKMFRELGSAWQVVKMFKEKGLQFPHQQMRGLCKGEVLLETLTYEQTLNVLKNPRYAGVYFYGKRRHSKSPNGKKITREVTKDQWHVFLPNSHEAYISYEDYEQNKKQLLQNARNCYGKNGGKSSPREGSALLQGIAICGRCGKKMNLMYKAGTPGLHPIYVCLKLRQRSVEERCQYIPGVEIDKAIGELLIESVTPLALEVALNVQAQLHARLEEADGLRKKQVERAQYEVELARHRYMQVDPKNRLVADSLEADWNEKLRVAREAQEEYTRQCAVDEQVLTSEQRERILSLASDFPRLWNDNNTPNREKKRMVRLLLEDVTLTRDEKISVAIRFKGGATKVFTLSSPINPFILRKTPPEIVKEVDQLLEHYHDAEIAHIFNERGLQTGISRPFTATSVLRVRRSYQLKDRYTRLRERGMLKRLEMATYLKTNEKTLKIWKDKGWIKTHAYGNSAQTILYEPPGDDFYDKVSKCSISSLRKGSYKNTQEVAGGVV